MTDNYYNPNVNGGRPEAGVPEIISRRARQVYEAMMFINVATKDSDLSKSNKAKTIALPAGTFEPKQVPLGPEASGADNVYPVPTAEIRPQLPTGYSPANNVVEMRPRQTAGPVDASFPMTEKEIMANDARRAIDQASGLNSVPATMQSVQSETRIPEARDADNFGLAA